MRDTYDGNGRHRSHPLFCVRAVGLANEYFVAIIYFPAVTAQPGLRFEATVCLSPA